MRGPDAGAQGEALFADEGIAVRTHEEALRALLAWIEAQPGGFHFVAAGHRVLHGGTSFSEPVVVDAEVGDRLDRFVPLAPLHQPHNLSAIRALMRLKPGIKQVACFDTAFHRTVPAVAQAFAPPRPLTEEGVRRYGLHGLPYESTASVLPDYLGAAAQGRVVVAHLGHGASLCAMKARNRVAMTMTFTPLAGLPMGTRCGSIDPAVVFYLMREKGMDLAAVSDLLQRQAGLLGISGISGDVRELLTSDRPQAAEAIEHFT